MHTALALLGIILGLIQFVRRKGDRAHRAVGYAYVYGLLIADGLAMLIFQFTGRLNILHFGAITNMICVAFGLAAVLIRKPGYDWRTSHYYWISWSYVGLLAAAATELLVRAGPFSGRLQVWSATIVATSLVTLVGFLLIRRHRPVIAS